MPKGSASRRRRTRHPTVAKTSSSAQTQVTEIRDFSNLSEALIADVLLKLSIEDIFCCACACRAFKNVTLENCFWQKYCLLHWGQKTEPSNWLASSSVSHVPNLPQPQNYRSLTMWFRQLDSFMGFWQGPVDAFTGQRDLFKFVWLSNCIACCNVASQSVHDMMYISPHHSMTGEIVDDYHCILRDYEESKSQMRCSSAAAAAASVAVGLFSDPQEEQLSSFESEMMLYIQCTVHSKRKKARQRCRGSVMVPRLHYFTRLPIPAATKHTWLTGLWSRAFSKAVMKSRLFEAILIEYDYSGSKAQISSRWIAGTHPPPEGEELWRVSARPTAGQWSSSLDELKYEGCGFVWDEVREQYIDDTRCVLEVVCKDCISFKWPSDGPEEGCITYHRLIEDEKD